MPIRDFIPGDAKDLTDEEKALLQRGDAKTNVPVHRDFIPGDDHVLQPVNDEFAEASRRVAEEAADASAARAAEDEFDSAAAHLRKMDVQSAVAHIDELPPYMRDVYLRAEAASDKPRKGILEAFPPPGPGPERAEESFEDEVAEAVKAGELTKDEAAALLADEE